MVTGGKALGMATAIPLTTRVKVIRREGKQVDSFAALFAAAFSRLDKAAGGMNYVTLHALRAAMPEYTRSEFDLGLRALRVARLYTCDASDGRHVRLEAYVREAGFEEGGNWLVYVARRSS